MFDNGRVFPIRRILISRETLDQRFSVINKKLPS
jgi:hypothetical protein